jgi:hypothetical protein
VDALPSEAEALLAISPDEFVQERQRVARALRDEGRREEAEAVAALRKPAPVVLAANRAARDRPAAAKGAAKAAARVAKAQLGTDTAAYRTALSELEESLDLLAQVALAHLSKGKPASEAVSRRLRDLLRNAVADETARGELVRGALREETETAGFGAFAGVTPPAPKRRAGRPDTAAKKKQEEEERRQRERALRQELIKAEKTLEEALQDEKRAARERQDAERGVESARKKLDRLGADAES